MPTKDLTIAMVGSGGDGVVTMGNLIAQAAARDGVYVVAPSDDQGTATVAAVEFLPVQHFASEQNDDGDPRGDGNC